MTCRTADIKDACLEAPAECAAEFAAEFAQADSVATVSRCRCVPIVRPRGVLDTVAAQSLREVIETALDESPVQSAIVDLSNVDMIGAAAMGLLAGRHEQLAVRNPSPRVMETLSLARLDRLFHRDRLAC